LVLPTHKKYQKEKEIYIMNGTIKFFDKKKGWGFIKADDGKEYFFHYTQIQMKGYKSLDNGDIVSFELNKDENNRICAVSVQPVLTLAMVLNELKNSNLHVMRIKDDKGVHGWYIVDKENRPVIDKEMDLVELGEYVGYKIVQASA